MRDELIGASAAIEALRQAVAEASRSDAGVLVTGESGSGKELVARAIHSRSVRRGRPFLALNCVAVPDALAESSLFGHRRGSFTDAVCDRPGLFEAARGGTVLLDEVGDMSSRMQSLLLQCLELGEARAIGDQRMRGLDVRVMAVTNRNLGEEVVRGVFRLDLYYRLNVLHIDVPPLRERPGDVPLLLAHFLSEYSRRYGQPRPVLSPGAIDALSEYAWPGNVRELRNAAERIVVSGEGLIDRRELQRIVVVGGSRPAEAERAPEPASVSRPRRPARGPSHIHDRSLTVTL
jgi:transcriptional regulator with GAF, ATPase, and Fis domain